MGTDQLGLIGRLWLTGVLGASFKVFGSLGTVGQAEVLAQCDGSRTGRRGRFPL